MYDIAKIKQLVKAPALLIPSKTTALSTIFDLLFQGGVARFTILYIHCDNLCFNFPKLLNYLR